MRVVGCFLKFENRFVLLHRLPHKADGNTWGLPSGKVEDGESDLDAIKRELFEETGYKANKNEFKLVLERDLTSPRGDVISYVTFRVELSKSHEVTLETSAHSAYKWVTAEEADQMDDLIHGLHKLLRLAGYIK